MTEYKRVDTSTLRGLKEAERLHQAGWTQVRVGLNTTLYSRKTKELVIKDAYIWATTAQLVGKTIEVVEEDEVDGPDGAEPRIVLFFTDRTKVAFILSTKESD